MQFLAGFFLLFFNWASFAEPFEPIRRVDELVFPEPETVVRVATARVVIADYDLIRKDFPHTKDMTSDQINTWLLNEVAFISQPQANQETVNSKIPLLLDTRGEPVSRIAQRPQLYGRGLVFEVQGGLIDGKGFGARINPKIANHKTGTATLGEMIREFIFQKKIQKVFEHSGSGFNTIESYAVIDWGFNTREDTVHDLHPAGAILRRAHARPGFPKNEPSLKHHFANTERTKTMETVLRTYGFTGTGEYSDENIEKVNIQVSRKGEMVDFGAVVTRSEFKKVALPYLGTEIIFTPEKGTFPQPDPEMSVPKDLWNKKPSSQVDAWMDDLWIRSHKLAIDLRKGTQEIKDVDNFAKTYLNNDHLTESTRGSFSYMQSDRYRASVYSEIVQIGTIWSRRFMEEFFQSGFAIKDLKSLERMASVKHTTGVSFMDLTFYEMKQHGIFDRYPHLLDMLPQAGQFSSDQTRYEFSKMKNSIRCHQFYK